MRPLLTSLGAPLLVTCLLSACASAPSGRLASRASAGRGPWPDLDEPAQVARDGAKDAALVVAIEKYPAAGPIPGAAANGAAWVDFLETSKGVPSVKLLQNEQATREEILEQARRTAGAVQPGGTLWFVFIGHGAPARDGSEGVLVGVDAQQTVDSLQTRGVRQSELLTALGNGRSDRKLVAVVDACFSGRNGRGQTLAPGTMPLVAVKPAAAAAGTTLLLAGTSSEFAGPLPGTGRPAFSYLALGALRGWGDSDHNGTITGAEVASYARRALRTLVTDRTQTPEVVGELSAPLSREASESGPELSASLSATGAGFGSDLAPITEVPRLPDFNAAAATTSLAQADVNMLRLLERAKTRDRGGVSPHEKAQGWNELADYCQQTGQAELGAAALERRDAWTKVGEALHARATQLRSVRDAKARDANKLRRLLALDDDVVSPVQKRAFQAEFDRTYAPWDEVLQKEGGSQGE